MDKIEITGIYLNGQKNTWEIFVELPNGEMKKVFDAADLQSENSHWVEPLGLRKAIDQSKRWKPYLEKYPPIKKEFK